MTQNISHITQSNCDQPFIPKQGKKDKTHFASSFLLSTSPPHIAQLQPPVAGPPRCLALPTARAAPASHLAPPPRQPRPATVSRTKTGCCCVVGSPVLRLLPSSVQPGFYHLRPPTTTPILSLIVSSFPHSKITHAY